MSTPTGSYYCPNCHHTTRTRENDPMNCVKCGHIMYWRPDPGTDGDRCIFCGTSELDEGGHYYFCPLSDELEVDEAEAAK
jgi:DNA-directed RNA polymerase subunit RPC12/RpoP